AAPTVTRAMPRAGVSTRSALIAAPRVDDAAIPAKLKAASSPLGSRATTHSIHDPTLRRTIQARRRAGAERRSVLWAPSPSALRATRDAPSPPLRPARSAPPAPFPAAP